VESLLSHEFVQVPTEKIQKEIPVQPLEELENQSDVQQEITTPSDRDHRRSAPTSDIETPLEEMILLLLSNKSLENFQLEVNLWRSLEFLFKKQETRTIEKFCWVNCHLLPLTF
jgi:hypothetical protein